MSLFLIRLTPMEPYFFGSEAGFQFGSVRLPQAQSYRIVSQNTPSQTTLLGGLRYAILANNNALIRDFGSEEQRRVAKEWIGADSFRFGEHTDLDFGCVKRISPLLIQNGDGAFLIPTPLNHHNITAEDQNKDPNQNYEPLEMLRFDGKLIRATHPILASNFNAKAVPVDGWMEVDTGRIHPASNLFTEIEQVGINARRNSPDAKDDDSYFIRIFKLFAQSYIANSFAFAFFAEIDERVPESFRAQVHLGKNRSLFTLTAEKQADASAFTALEDKIRARLAGDTPFAYLLGDAYFAGKVPCEYNIARRKSFRNLTTKYTEKSHYDRFRKSERCYWLYEAGSVFYGMKDANGLVLDKNAEKLGMCALIEIPKGE